MIAVLYCSKPPLFSWFIIYKPPFLMAKLCCFNLVFAVRITLLPWEARIIFQCKLTAFLGKNPPSFILYFLKIFADKINENDSCFYSCAWIVCIQITFRKPSCNSCILIHLNVWIQWTIITFVPIQNSIAYTLSYKHICV